MSVANIIDPVAGQIRPEFLPVVVGGGTVALPLTSGNVPITLTGDVAGTVLKANKLYRIEIAYSLGSTVGATPISMEFVAAPNASVVVATRDEILNNATIGAGITFDDLYASGLLQASTDTSINAKFEITFVGTLDICQIKTVVLTLLN